MVAVRAWTPGAREGEPVAGGFFFQPEFFTGAAPFRAVTGDPAPASPVMGDEMGEFVFERALDFAWERGQAGVQSHELQTGVSEAGGAFEPGGPFDPERLSERWFPDPVKPMLRHLQ